MEPSDTGSEQGWGGGCMLFINTLTAYKSFGWKTWWWPMLAETYSFYHFL